MDKFTKDKIITEFEMATSCKASESSQINIELLKKETKKTTHTIAIIWIFVWN